MIERWMLHVGGASAEPSVDIHLRCAAELPLTVLLLSVIVPGSAVRGPYTSSALILNATTFSNGRIATDGAVVHRYRHLVGGVVGSGIGCEMPPPCSCRIATDSAVVDGHIDAGGVGIIELGGGYTPPRASLICP